MNRRLFLALQVVLLVFSSPQAHAYQNDDIELLSMSLEELSQVRITVASLFDTDELHAASNTSVVTEQDWQRIGARRTLDAIDQLPATLVIPHLYGTEIIAIRGYAQPTSARGVATNLDGIHLNNFAFGTGQYDTPNINLGVLDRIEMIRGPASALYGTDAFHGVLSLHSFESEQDINDVRAEMASNGYYQVAARHSGAIAESVRLNLAAAGSGEPDQDVQYTIDNPAPGAANHYHKEQRYDSQTISLKLASDPDAAWSWHWGTYVDQFESVDGVVGPVNYQGDQETANYMTQLGVSHNLEHGRSLQASAYYRDSSVERVSVAPPGVPVPGGTNLLDENVYGINLTLRQPRQNQDDTQWALSAGYDVQNLVRAETSLEGTPAGTPPIEVMGGKRSREIANLVFEADTPTFGEQWLLVYGGRVDQYSDFGTESSPRLGLIYLPTTDSAIKLLYGRAFRAPTAFELYIKPINNIGQQGNQELKPEIMDTLELVLMRQGQNWKGNVVLFENRWHDTISLDITPTVSTYSNTGSSRARGVESTLTWLPGPWRVEFNAAYTRSRNLTTKEDYELFPQLMGHLGIGYDWRAHNTELYVINRAHSKVDDVIGNAARTPQKLPVYWRTDLMLKHDFSAELEGHVSIINLFDRDNYLPSALGVQGGYPDDSASILVGFRYGF